MISAPMTPPRRSRQTSNDEACSLALAVGAPHYRFVRTYLERRPSPALSIRQVDPLIRDLTHYRDLIARMTKEPE